MIRFSKLLKKYPSFMGIILSTIIFTAIYYHLGTDNFYLSQVENVGLIEALYFSASVQSLLGLGDITPKTELAKVFVIIQVFITIVLTFLFSSGSFV